MYLRRKTMKSTSRTVKTNNQLLTKLREYAQRRGVAIPGPATTRDETKEGAAIVVLLSVISKQLSMTVTELVDACSGGPSKWKKLAPMVDVHELCMFVFYDMCEGSAENLFKLVDVFERTATFTGSMVMMPAAAVETMAKTLHMTNPLRNYNSFMKLWITSRNGKSSHTLYTIVNEHIALLCAFAYYSMSQKHGATPEHVVPPMWMVDALVCVFGYETVKNKWHSWFGSISFPGIESLVVAQCPGIPLDVMELVIDVMASSVMPMTYLTYSLDHAWENEEQRTRKTTRDAFPEMEEQTAPFVAAIYASCAYISKMHYTGTEAEADSLYSFIRYALEKGWDNVQDHIVDEGMRQLAQLMRDTINERYEGSRLYWVQIAFQQIERVIRTHCVKSRAMEDEYAWAHSTGVISMVPVTLEEVRTQLEQKKMMYELYQTQRFDDGWTYLMFDTTDPGAKGLQLDTSKHGLSNRTRPTEVSGQKSCLDVVMAMWWHTHGPRGIGGRVVTEYYLLRTGCRHGYLALHTRDWEISMRGMQWSMSLCTKMQIIKRCPAYMAVVNMLLYPDEELARWALICINTMITGIMPFQEHSGCKDIPLANTMEFRRCLNLLLQIITSCALTGLYGDIAGMVRKCTCEGGNMLEAMRCLIQYGSRQRKLSGSSVALLAAYMQGPGHKQAIWDTLVDKAHEADRVQFNALVAAMDAVVPEEWPSAKDMHISEFTQVLYLICGDTDYIQDTSTALRIFEGIGSLRDQKQPTPAPRAPCMWDMMVQITNSNLLFNYFVANAEHPIQGTISTSGPPVPVPVARVINDVALYEMENFTKNTDIATLATLLFLLEQNGYLQYPESMRKRRRNADDDENDDSIVFLDTSSLGSLGNDSSNSGWSVNGKSRKRLVRSDAVLENSEASRSSFYEYDVKKKSERTQTGLKMRLDIDTPLFPYIKPETYGSRLCELPLALNNNNFVVYERRGLLLPALPVGLGPEETRNKNAKCGVGPLTSASLGFIFSVLCTRIRRSDALRVV